MEVPRSLIGLRAEREHRLKLPGLQHSNYETVLLQEQAKGPILRKLVGVCYSKDPDVECINSLT